MNGAQPMVFALMELIDALNVKTPTWHPYLFFGAVFINGHGDRGPDQTKL